MRKRIPGLLALAMLLLAAPPALATGYHVYCSYNKIEIDSRGPEQMRIARGSSACLFRSFRHRMDAESFVRNNWGRPGARCSCR